MSLVSLIFIEFCFFFSKKTLYLFDFYSCFLKKKPWNFIFYLYISSNLKHKKKNICLFFLYSLALILLKYVSSSRSFLFCFVSALLNCSRVFASNFKSLIKYRDWISSVFFGFVCLFGPKHL